MKSWDAPRFTHLPANHIIYRGPSMLTGDPIVVVATAKNGNRKLGDVLQLWAIPQVEPIVAVHTGADAAVCGDCALRGDGTGKERVCYVEHWRSVENIWQALPKARTVTPLRFGELIAGTQVRITSYGDPVAVPLEVWEPVLAHAAGWTAYTHQWRLEIAKPFRKWCMASVETALEQSDAWAQGWRTFRVRDVDGAIDPRFEVLCPHEVDPEVHCDRCSLCRGARRPAKSIVITVHGNRAKWFPASVIRRGQWGDR